MSRILASLAEATKLSVGDDCSSSCASLTSGSIATVQSDNSIRSISHRSIRGWHKEDNGEEEPVRPARGPVHQQESDEDAQPTLPSRPRFSSDTSLEVTTVEEEEEGRENLDWVEEEFDEVVNSVLNVVREEDSNSSTVSLNDGNVPMLEIPQSDDSKLVPSNRSTNSSLRDTEESSSDSSDDGKNTARRGFGANPDILRKIIIEPRNQRAALLRNHFSLARITSKRKTPQNIESETIDDVRQMYADTVDILALPESVEAQRAPEEENPETPTTPAQSKSASRCRLPFSRLLPQRSLRGLFRRGNFKRGRVKRASTNEEEMIDFGSSEQKLPTLGTPEVWEATEEQGVDSKVQSEETPSPVESRKIRSSDGNLRPRPAKASQRNRTTHRKGGDPVAAIPEEPTGPRGHGFWERFRPTRHVPAATPLPTLSTTPAEEKHNQELLAQALAPIVPAQVLEFTVCNPVPVEFTVCNVRGNTKPSVIATPKEYPTIFPKESPKKSVEDPKEFTVCSSVNIPNLPLTVLEEEITDVEKADDTNEANVAMATEDIFDSSSTIERSSKVQGPDIAESSATEEETLSQQVDNERSLTDFSPVELQLSAKIGEDLVEHYGPYPTKASFAKQLETLPSENRVAFNGIKDAWQEDWAQKRGSSKQPWNDEIILRVAAFTEFSLEEAVELLRRMPSKHWHNTVRRLTASKLADDLKSIAVVPLPKLTTKLATDVVYLCPARYNTSVKPIRLLTYAMNCMYDRHGAAPSNCKVALLMNMEGYSFSSKQQEAFAFTDWITWMEFIQGKNGPLSVVEVLLVNVSTEFKLVWKARLRSKCQEGFAWRFNFVEDASRLDEYLQPGFEPYLPADLPRGQASVQKLVRDFSTYRQALEEIVLGNVEGEDTDSDKESIESGSASAVPRTDKSRHASMPRSSKRPTRSSGHRWEMSGKSSSPPVLPDRRNGLGRSTSAEKVRASSGSSHRRHTTRVPSLGSLPESSEKKVGDRTSESRRRELAVASRIREFDLGVHRRDVNRTMSSKSLPESRKVRDRKAEVNRQASMPIIKSLKSSSNSARRSSNSSSRSRATGEKLTSSRTSSRSDRRRDMSRASSANMIHVSKSPKKSSRRRMMKRTISLPSLPETIKEEDEEEEDLSTNSGTLRQIPRASSSSLDSNSRDSDSSTDEKDEDAEEHNSLRLKATESLLTSPSAMSTTKLHNGPPVVPAGLCGTARVQTRSKGPALPTSPRRSFRSHGEPLKRSGSSSSV